MEVRKEFNTKLETLNENPISIFFESKKNIFLEILNSSFLSEQLKMESIGAYNKFLEDSKNEDKLENYFAILGEGEEIYRMRYSDGTYDVNVALEFLFGQEHEYVGRKLGFELGVDQIGSKTFKEKKEVLGYLREEFIKMSEDFYK
jgi:hypothetical protein